MGGREATDRQAHFSSSSSLAKAGFRTSAEGTGEEGARKSNGGWLGHSQLSPTHQAFAQSRYPLGKGEEGTLGLFQSDHSLNVRTGYFSFFSLSVHRYPCQIGGAWTPLSRRRGARRIWEIRGVFPIKKYFLIQVFRVGSGRQCWARLFLNIKVFVAFPFAGQGWVRSACFKLNAFPT